MATNIDPFCTIAPASEAESASIRNYLETQDPGFDFDENAPAVFAFGGTVQSAYLPASENIFPVSMNPVLSRIQELMKQFGLTSKHVTGATLISKDSRDISTYDIARLVHTIGLVPNKKVIVTCGTYGLPVFAQILDTHFGQGRSDKIIGVTGSMLPQIITGHDVDINAGGTLAALNVFSQLGQKGVVFAQFHGRVIVGQSLHDLNLHLPEFNPKLVVRGIEIR